MSGEETLAQVYREIQAPKLRNLEKAGLIIFVYSLVFTAGVSFLAYAVIPDETRAQYFGNLISGMAMNFVGPYHLRLAFQGFVVLVGILMLAGAVNTAIVGSNGVLSRVSEDGILPEWFRHPHPRFGTSYRIINMVVALQLLTIVLSQGNIIWLGEAYAFGVMWSFAMKGLGVLVLRFTQPGQREFQVPLNFKVGRTHLPLGLGLITLTLFALAGINLLTKQVATIAGVSCTLIFFLVFVGSEKLTHRRRSEVSKMDQFHLAPGDEVTPQSVGCRPASVLVLARDYNTLYNLAAVLDRVNPAQQDVVVLHIRILRRSGSGEHPLEPEQLFSAREQMLFTQALALAEKKGKTVHLAVAAATEIWDGIMRSAQSLQASTVVLGTSAKMTITEEARRAGLAWERLPDPKPHITLEIYTPSGYEEIFYLGPHAPRLTPKEIELLHKIWLRFSTQLGEKELHHHDVVHFALAEIEKELAQGKNDEILGRLKDHLSEIQTRRVPHL